MEQVLEFLNQLKENNNREWFEEHRADYLQAKNTFDTFAQNLIEGISAFDPTISNLTLKDCTYRIYRDTRFAKDKTPYKTHMGVYIAPYGKKSGYAGYYFHIEAKESNYIGGHILTTGSYRPPKELLKSIREEVMLNGEEFLDTITKAEGFHLEQHNTLSRIPYGFPQDSPYSQYFKLKDFFVTKEIDNNFLNSPNLLSNTIAEFKKTTAFKDLLNKAIQYAYENGN